MRLLACIFFTIIIFNSLASDTDIGNGGDALVCRNNQKKIVSAELLDYYEARILRNTNVYLGGKKLSYLDKIKLVLKRLKKHSPYRAKKYLAFAEEFEQNANIKKDIVLTDISDSKHLLRKKGCEIEQVIIYTPPIFPGDKPYLVNKEIWDYMDTTNKAGIVLHEAIYFEAIAANHVNSIKTRYFNTLIATKGGLASMDSKKFHHLISELLEFEYFEFAGFLFNVNYLTFHENRSLKEATLYHKRDYSFILDSKLRSAGNLFPKSVVSFYDNNQIKNIYGQFKINPIIGKNSLTILSGCGHERYLKKSFHFSASITNFKISFYKDGLYQTFCIEEDNSILIDINNKNKLVSRNMFGEVELSITSKIIKASYTLPVHDHIEPVNILGHDLLIHKSDMSDVYFHPNGSLKEFTFLNQMFYVVSFSYGKIQYSIAAKSFSFYNSDIIESITSAEEMIFPLRFNNKTKKIKNIKQIHFSTKGIVLSFTLNNKATGFSFKMQTDYSFWKLKVKCFSYNNFKVWGDTASYKEQGCSIATSTDLEILNQEIKLIEGYSRSYFSLWDNGNLKFIDNVLTYVKSNINGLNLFFTKRIWLTRDGTLEGGILANSIYKIQMKQGLLDLISGDGVKFSLNGFVKSAYTRYRHSWIIQNKAIETQGTIYFHKNNAIKRARVVGGYFLKTNMGVETYIENETCFNPQGLVILCENIDEQNESYR